MNPVQLTNSLRAESESQGFDLVGCAPAVDAQGVFRLTSWIDAGFDGEMHYLSERLEAYRNPKSVLDGAQSVVMLALNYNTLSRPHDDQPGTGKIARYAWGQYDYHDLIHRKLKLICRSIRDEFPDLKIRGVVDTAPLLEREFAQLAGLGWFAKNTMLINKQQGSWFFLAALIVDRELVYDSPNPTAHCGTCTACLTACPTNAFPAPHTLDATRCISYLTIEHRSAIPLELRPLMGDWILGCDVCQDVCPWNNKSPQTREPAFFPKEDQNPIDLLELFDLDDDAFRARFRKTPLWRPKRRGILRNAAIALGNRPTELAQTALAKGLNDLEPLVRGASAWALGRQLFAEAETLLTARLEIESDREVRSEIEFALAHFREKSSFK